MGENLQGVEDFRLEHGKILSEIVKLF